MCLSKMVRVDGLFRWSSQTGRTCLGRRKERQPLKWSFGPVASEANVELLFKWLIFGKLSRGGCSTLSLLLVSITKRSHNAKSKSVKLMREVGNKVRTSCLCWVWVCTNKLILDGNWSWIGSWQDWRERERAKQKCEWSGVWRRKTCFHTGSRAPPQSRVRKRNGKRRRGRRLEQRHCCLQMCFAYFESVSSIHQQKIIISWRI